MILQLLQTFSLWSQNMASRAGPFGPVWCPLCSPVVGLQDAPLTCHFFSLGCLLCLTTPLVLGSRPMGRLDNETGISVPIFQDPLQGPISVISCTSHKILPGLQFLLEHNQLCSEKRAYLTRHF